MSTRAFSSCVSPPVGNNQIQQEMTGGIVMYILVVLSDEFFVMFIAVSSFCNKLANGLRQQKYVTKHGSSELKVHIDGTGLSFMSVLQ